MRWPDLSQPVIVLLSQSVGDIELLLLKGLFNSQVLVCSTSSYGGYPLSVYTICVSGIGMALLSWKPNTPSLLVTWSYWTPCRAHLTALPSGPLGSNPSSPPLVLHWVGDICFCLRTCSPGVGVTSGVEVQHKLQDCSLIDYSSPSLQPVPVRDECLGGCWEV